jgi:hypothetical protein
VTSEDVGLVYYTQVPKTVNTAGVGYTTPLNKEPILPHVPVRENKRRFKPLLPINKRSRRKNTQ